MQLHARKSDGFRGSRPDWAPSRPRNRWLWPLFNFSGLCLEIQCYLITELGDLRLFCSQRTTILLYRPGLLQLGLFSYYITYLCDCKILYVVRSDYQRLNVVWNNSFSKIFGCYWREMFRVSSFIVSLYLCCKSSIKEKKYFESSL